MTPSPLKVKQNLWGGHLCLDLQLHSKSGKLKYQKNKEDILIDFL